MSSSRTIITPNTFWEYIYNRFPQSYKLDDEGVDFALKRYLQGLGKGYESTLEDANGLLNLYDASLVKSEILPHLFKSFGFEVFNGLPEDYLRNLLPALGFLYARKGSLDIIDYLVSIVSGVKSEVEVEEGTGDYTKGVRVYIDLDYDAGEVAFPDDEQMRRIIREFVPFYCDVTVVFQISYSDVASLRNNIDNHFDEVSQSFSEIDGFRVIEDEDEPVITYIYREKVQLKQTPVPAMILGVHKLNEALLGHAGDDVDSFSDTIIQGENPQMTGVEVSEDAVATSAMILGVHKLNHALMGENGPYTPI